MVEGSVHMAATSLNLQKVAICKHKIIFYNITVLTFLYINSALVNIKLFCLKILAFWYIFNICPLKSTTIKIISLVLKYICFYQLHCLLWISPGIYEVLCQADVGRCSRNGDLTVWWPLHGISNFDLSPRHLTDFINFGALTSDYAAY